MSQPVPVPATLEEVDVLYRNLIASTILRVSRAKAEFLPDEDVDDLVQHVYLKLIERNFLQRCRSYLAAHPGKSFTVSLITFVRNLTTNFLRDRGRAARRIVLADDVLHTNYGREDVLDRAYAEGPEPMTESHENAILARQYLGEIAGFLMTEPEILAVIDAALREDGSLAVAGLRVRHKGRVVHETTVRRYVSRLKARAREVAA